MNLLMQIVKVSDSVTLTCDPTKEHCVITVVAGEKTYQDTIPVQYDQHSLLRLQSKILPGSRGAALIDHTYNSLDTNGRRVDAANFYQAGLAYMSAREGDPMPALWMLGRDNWHPADEIDNLAMAGAMFRAAAKAVISNRCREVYERMERNCADMIDLALGR